MTPDRTASEPRPAALFCDIVRLITQGRVRPTADTLVEELFGDDTVFGALEFEQALYSLEASLRREMADTFYDGGIEHVFRLTLVEFFDAFLGPVTPDDPLFVAQMFDKFAHSAQLQKEADARGGVN
jgi:hypothetical protein